MAGSSLVSSFGFGRAKPDPNAREEALSDDDYLSWGKTSNTSELSSSEGSPLFRLLEDEEGFDALFEVPFGLKHVKDLHVVMRHSVAVVGERREDLTPHSLFHPAFAGFALGFSIGLAQAHRVKHLGVRATLTRLSRRQAELCDQWGVEVATYYLAVVDSDGIFGKDSDIELYGISDRWRLLSDERRLEAFDRVQDCVAAGKEAAYRWFEDETADVPPYFLDALVGFIEAYPDRSFD
jgi:hypothetical protein